MTEPLVIDMNECGEKCSICGKYDYAKWGVPVDDCGVIVGNNYVGEWSSRPACRNCHKEHESGKHVGKMI